MAKRTGKENELSQRMQALILSDPELEVMVRQHLRLISGVGAYGPMSDPDYQARLLMSNKEYGALVNQSYQSLAQAFADRGFTLPDEYSFQVGVDPVTREMLPYVQESEFLARNDVLTFSLMGAAVAAPVAFGAFFGGAAVPTGGAASGGAGAGAAAGGAGAAGTTAAGGAAAAAGFGFKDWLALGTTLAGLGLDVFGTLKAGSETKEIAEMNAQAAEAQAADELARGREEEQTFRSGVRVLLGEQRAGFAAQNVDVGVGSPVHVAADTARLGELDALTIRRNAKRASDARLREAAILRKGGQAAQTASRYNAAGTVLGGASTLLQRYGFGGRA